MPHKRAKASIRKANSLKIGFDLPPIEHQAKKRQRRRKDAVHGTKKGATHEEVPKNMFRILNAEKIRADYRMRKFQEKNLIPSAEGLHKLKSTEQVRANKSGNSSKSQDKIQILPSESLSSFNRRVETTLRPQVTAVMRSARNKSTQAIAEPEKGKKRLESAEDTSKKKLGGDPNEPKPTDPKENQPIKDFAPRPSKFPLQDTVMEPPSLSLTRSMKKSLSSSSNSNHRTPLPISAAQKKSLELERARVIERYRKLKEERQAQL